MSPSDEGGARPDATPALLTYMTTSDGPTRDAAFLRTYAARVRDGSAALWEIPSTVAGTIEAVADRLEAAAAQLAVAQAERDQLLGLAQTVLGDEADDVDDVVLHVKNALAILRTQHEALAARVQALAQQWKDPEFWKDRGSLMDSQDCADALVAALAAAASAPPATTDDENETTNQAARKDTTDG